PMAVNAPPMITPTAISTTLPREINSLNSLMKPLEPLTRPMAASFAVSLVSMFGDLLNILWYSVLTALLLHRLGRKSIEARKMSEYAQTPPGRSEEHTAERQSRFDRVCRIL